MKKIIPLFAILCALRVGPALAQREKGPTKLRASAMAEQQVALNANELHWVAGPPALPAGAKLALVAGNPAKKGLYTLRLQVPSGYRIPPHTHPTTENVTVISGAMSFGMGDRFDATTGKKIKAGGFASMPAGMKHYAWASGDTVVQVHGEGPF